MIDLFEQSRAVITPRSYQVEDHDESFVQWDRGDIGTLTRVFTGGGKTISACLKADTWLRRSDRHRVMVVSYEKELVHQFAEEIHDVLGIHPGIEMGELRLCENGEPPKIVVATRQSLQLSKPPTEEMVADFAEHGITEEDLGSCPKMKAEPLLRALSQGADPTDVKIELFDINSSREAHQGAWSRIHKFSPDYHWLLFFDEAHKHAYHRPTVKHIVDWFEQNPTHRRNGLTATPKRSDNKSLGDKMFPAISIDYPLYSAARRCAVTDGYAVPYVQKYISLEGVDFANLKKVAGDYDDHELERVLLEEAGLAALVEPMLEMSGDRRTIVFSPTVDMAKRVANYINARSKTCCPECGEVKWIPSLLIGDGAACSCGASIKYEDVTHSNQSRSTYGEIPHSQRRETYVAHQTGEFQYLSVCGLCREGYNDPAISCVAVFRPVSKKASSLAEQMKGRGCRVLRGTIEGLETAEERLEAIAASEKPNCLVIDLVGITGLADCASTAEIYADSYPDEVIERATEKMVDAEVESDVSAILAESQEEIEEERERIKQERMEAERRAQEEYDRRAKAQAEARYSTQDIGHGASFDPNAASPRQLRYIEFLGFEAYDVQISKRQASRIIGQLKDGCPLEEVAHTNRIHSWREVGPSRKQISLMKRNGLPTDGVRTKQQASYVISAHKEPEKAATELLEDLRGCGSIRGLDPIRHNLTLVRGILPEDLLQKVYKAGVQRREELEF